ncbi:MAG TPA: mechanosensitive ion channel family protein [Dermatophilaceae bacterium]|nr:mechanosensitive ion channel family protein [Dermatophilaceae bacterium]
MTVDGTALLDRFVEWLLGNGLRILLTVVLALLVRWVLFRAITRLTTRSATSPPSDAEGGPGRAGRVLAQAAGLASERHAQRMLTLGSLLRSITTLTVFGVAALTVMALVGIPLGPVLASAGVGGVALGFGAQSLVKDFLSGVFMILEDQFGVGDVIDTGEAVGTVEGVSLRVTRLRDADGVVWYVRNGEVVRVANRSQGWSTALVDVPVSYAESVQRVRDVLRDVADGLAGDEDWQDRLLGPPEVVGVESITGPVMTMRVTARCAAGEHVAVQRELLERIKTALDAAGVKAPPLPPSPAGGPR